MSDAEATCTAHRATNGRHYLTFAVADAGDRPDEFSLQPSPTEYERLAEGSTAAETEDQRVGRVPVVYDDGWTVDWDALEG